MDYHTNDFENAYFPQFSAISAPSSLQIAAAKLGASDSAFTGDHVDYNHTHPSNSSDSETVTHDLSPRDGERIMAEAQIVFGQANRFAKFGGRDMETLETLDAYSGLARGSAASSSSSSGSSAGRVQRIMGPNGNAIAHISRATPNVPVTREGSGSRDKLGGAGAGDESPMIDDVAGYTSYRAQRALANPLWGQFATPSTPPPASTPPPVVHNSDNAEQMSDETAAEETTAVSPQTVMKKSGGKIGPFSAATANAARPSRARAARARKAIVDAMSESDSDSSSDSDTEDTADNWVECESCQKWRRLPRDVDIDTEADFFCEMLSNTVCADPEDTWDDSQWTASTERRKKVTVPGKQRKKQAKKPAAVVARRNTSGGPVDASLVSALFSSNSDAAAMSGLAPVAADEQKRKRKHKKEAPEVFTWKPSADETIDDVVSLALGNCVATFRAHLPADAKFNMDTLEECLYLPNLQMPMAVQAIDGVGQVMLLSQKVVDTEKKKNFAAFHFGLRCLLPVPNIDGTSAADGGKVDVTLNYDLRVYASGSMSGTLKFHENAAGEPGATRNPEALTAAVFTTAKTLEAIVFQKFFDAVNAGQERHGRAIIPRKPGVRVSGMSKHSSHVMMFCGRQHAVGDLTMLAAALEARGVTSKTSPNGGLCVKRDASLLKAIGCPVKGATIPEGGSFIIRTGSWQVMGTKVVNTRQARNALIEEGKCLFKLAVDSGNGKKARK